MEYVFPSLRPTISPHTTSCFHRPRRPSCVKKPSDPPTSSLQSLASTSHIRPTSCCCAVLSPNVIHFPIRDFKSDNQRGFAMVALLLDGSSSDEAEYPRECRATDVAVIRQAGKFVLRQAVVRRREEAGQEAGRKATVIRRDMATVWVGRIAMRCAVGERAM